MIVTLTSPRIGRQRTKTVRSSSNVDLLWFVTVEGDGQMVAGLKKRGAAFRFEVCGQYRLVTRYLELHHNDMTVDNVVGWYMLVARMRRIAAWQSIRSKRLADRPCPVGKSRSRRWFRQRNGSTAAVDVMSPPVVKTPGSRCRSGRTRRTSAAPAVPSRCSTG
jgi:hypothetical protein